MRNETQMRSLVRGHIDGLTVKPGQVYWTDRKSAARHIDERLAELAVRPQEQPEAGPKEKPEAGPSEVPGRGPLEKKQCLKRRPDFPVDRFSTVERVWSGPVVVIATGPSLTKEQVERVRISGVPTIAINDVYLWAPFADIVYFADAKWWKWQTERADRVEPWKAFAGQRCTIHTTGHMTDDPGCHILRNARKEGLSVNPEEICTGSNSGYQGMNIATLAGGDPVILLGFDMRAHGGKGEKPVHHFFGDHPDGTMPPYAMLISRFKTGAIAAKELGIRILNATPGSALDCFDRVELESVLPHP